jgi:hypothetical protein
VGGITEEVYIECQKCDSCVIPDSISGFCVCDETPYQLTATIENTTDCDCGAGATATLYYNFNPEDEFWFGIFPSFCGRGDLEITLRCDGGTCGGNIECERFELEVCTGITCADADSGTAGCCDPFELLFTGIGGGCSDCDDPATADFDIRVTA